VTIIFPHIDQRSLALATTEMPRLNNLQRLAEPSYILRKVPDGQIKLFSARDIELSEVIAETPVQVVSQRDRPILRKLGLDALCFEWPSNDKGARDALAFGAGAFIGHSAHPNCYWKADVKRRAVIILPLRAINEGEELTINYNQPRMRCEPTRSESPEGKPISREGVPLTIPRAIVADIPGLGRGLVALQDIKKGQAITKSPVRVFKGQSLQTLRRATCFEEFTYDWPEKKHIAAQAVVIGLPSFVNHSSRANSFHVADPRQEVVSLIAHRDIEQGEQITMNYAGDPDEQNLVGWSFSDMGKQFRVGLNFAA
jgi:hypothetical protein